MKVTVTHLKAPWPAGAGVGSVVEFDGAAPACFAGKFVPAADDAEASHRWEPPAPPPALVEEPAAAAADPDALKAAEALLAEARREAEELRGMIAALTEQRDAARAELEALKTATEPVNEAPSKTTKAKA